MTVSLIDGYTEYVADTCWNPEAGWRQRKGLTEIRKLDLAMHLTSAAFHTNRRQSAASISIPTQLLYKHAMLDVSISHWTMFAALLVQYTYRGPSAANGRAGNVGRPSRASATVLPSGVKNSEPDLSARVASAVASGR